MRGSFEERFWAKVDVQPEGQCWEWTGHRNEHGYGRMRVDEKLVLSHRVSAFIHGLLDSLDEPEDRKGWGYVLHHCDNPSCCNPWHFEVSTKAKNTKDAYGRGLIQKPNGGRNPAVKLTEEDVRAIRAAYAAGGVRQVDLAGEYGVSQAQISAILRGTSWGHL